MSSEKSLQVWRKDLNEDLTLDNWKKTCEETQTHSINTRLELIQYKLLMRTYLVRISDTCNKCNDVKGTLLH